jgi:hypothetical protein
MMVASLPPSAELTRNVASAMEHAVDDNTLGFDLIHQPVGTDDQLTKIRELCVREWPSSLAELGEAIASLTNTLRESGREGG